MRKHAGPNGWRIRLRSSALTHTSLNIATGSFQAAHKSFRFLPTGFIRTSVRRSFVVLNMLSPTEKTNPHHFWAGAKAARMTQTWPRAPGIITRCNSELERTRSLEHRYQSHDRREMWGDNGKEVTQGSGWQRWGHPGTPVSPSPSPVAQTPFPPVLPTWAPSNFLPISTCSWSSAGWKSSPAWNWVLSIDTHSLHFVFVGFLKINIYIFLKDFFSPADKAANKAANTPSRPTAPRPRCRFTHQQLPMQRQPATPASARLCTRR